MAGIVHQRVERSEARLRLRDRGLDLIGHRDVAGQRERALRLVLRGHGARKRFAIDIEQGHAPAVGKESPCGGKPDAARGAGDEGSLVPHEYFSERKGRTASAAFFTLRVLDASVQSFTPQDTSCAGHGLAQWPHRCCSPWLPALSRSGLSRTAWPRATRIRRG
jgi:hypothetical protein